MVEGKLGIYLNTNSSFNLNCFYFLVGVKMKDIEKMHQLFVENVAVNRNLDIKTVEELADGFTMLGQDAKEKGLIDEIGNINDAKEWLKSQLGIEPELCIY